jgi:hypothetical protein
MEAVEEAGGGTWFCGVSMSTRSALAETIPSSHVSPLLRYRCDSDIVHFAREWTSLVQQRRLRP